MNLGTSHIDRAVHHYPELSASLQETMGLGECISQISREVKLVGSTDFTVLITGETGSGKELVAGEIHHASPRSSGPFLPLDCGSIPQTLIESELFGHEKGAFTGADAMQPGRFEIASGGTLFLDEISSLPLSVQPKLLRALQERQVYRIGGTAPIPVDMRIVVATNQDLLQLVQAKRFRRDLFYRLNEFTITVPPLRERREDILYLANRFIESTNWELKKNVTGISPSALDILVNHPWPGNVRELRNVVRRAVLLTDSLIEPEHLSIQCAEQRTTSMPHELDDTIELNLPFKETIRRAVTRVEREILTRALQQTGGNKAKAARILQIDYKTIHNKIREYGISICIGGNRNGEAQEA